MSENVKVDTCRSFREKIYTMIFPRWMLLSIGGVFVVVLLTLYGLNRQVSKDTSDTMSKTQVIDIQIEYLKEGQERIVEQLDEQGKVLATIDKKVSRLNGN